MIRNARQAKSATRRIIYASEIMATIDFNKRRELHPERLNVLTPIMLNPIAGNKERKEAIEQTLMDPSVGIMAFSANSMEIAKDPRSIGPIRKAVFGIANPKLLVPELKTAVIAPELKMNISMQLERKSKREL